ncbi:MAG TPA: type 4a pilus biogenesis protein PilO [Bradyrhizobium sp.]
MALSKRENYIAIAACAAIGLLGLDHFVLTPYQEQRAKVALDQQILNQRSEEVATLFTRQHQLRKVWTELQQGGVKLDSSQAASRTLSAVESWAQSAGVNTASVRPERTAQEGAFEVISFDVLGTGTMRSISRLLWALETATIPVRVNEVQITPVKEGTDELSVRLSVSALCMPPAADNAAAGFGSSALLLGGQP